ncbi:hypothetical protein B0O80DRAFT_307174 [Mortierella sp. GBAus27b]|nr:hypothetical protein B0O80DRAFT_307174 [Mortierella sp. GBAus27b]
MAIWHVYYLGLPATRRGLASRWEATLLFIPCSSIRDGYLSVHVRYLNEQQSQPIEAAYVRLLQPSMKWDAGIHTALLFSPFLGRSTQGTSRTLRILKTIRRALVRVAIVRQNLWPLHSACLALRAPRTSGRTGPTGSRERRACLTLSKPRYTLSGNRPAHLPKAIFHYDAKMIWSNLGLFASVQLVIAIIPKMARHGRKTMFGFKSGPTDVASGQPF